MALFTKKHHKLPTYPKTIKKLFNEYCVNVDDEQIPLLKEKVTQAVNDAKKKFENGALVDVQTAEEISNRCLYILDRYHEFSKKKKKLIIGAVCYFAIGEDPISENIFASGYDDDAAVVNYVLEKLNINDMFINIE